MLAAIPGSAQLEEEHEVLLSLCKAGWTLFHSWSSC